MTCNCHGDGRGEKDDLGVRKCMCETFEEQRTRYSREDRKGQCGWSSDGNASDHQLSQDTLHLPVWFLWLLNSKATLGGQGTV